MKKTLFILVAIVFVLNLSSKAEDFSAVNSDGDTIYYKITSSIAPYTVAVSFKGNDFYTYQNEYTGSVTIPDSVLYNGNYYNVTSIDGYAFHYCIGLTSITIPNSVTYISYDAFQSCNGLTSVTIPNSVTYIGDYAFHACSGLTSITIPNNNAFIGEYAFHYTPWYHAKPDGLIYINNTLYAYKGTMPANTSIIVQSGTEAIAGSAFSGCSGLTSITIPNSVTSIGRSAFGECTGLTSITIPPSITSINSGVFAFCHALTSVTMPNSITYIGNSAFLECTGLTSITIPSSLISIDNYAFYNCSGLTSIKIPNSVTSIGYQAFCKCSGITSFVIPPYVDSIGLEAFRSCSSLDTVFFNAIYCNYIGDSTLPVFSWCNNFKTLVIGDSVQNIPSYAFYNRSTLTSIITKAINPPILQTNSFYGVGRTIPVYIPCNSVQSYNSAPFWSEFTNQITNTSTEFIDITICDGETFNFYGTIIDSAGVYTYFNGCNNVTLTLNINPITVTNQFDTICKGVEYSNYGFSFTSDTSGIYTQNLQTINGCDSIIVLNLVVNPTPDVPHDLSVHNITLSNTILSWKGNADSYDIYRDDTLIANVSDTVYVENYEMSINVTYCYNIKAKNDNGCESALSDTLCFGLYGLGNIENSNIQTKLYPNPTEGKAKLEVERLNSDAEVLVYDMIGRVIQKHTINKGNNELEIDLSIYAKGVYSIRIINDNINQTKKLIVQ